MRVGMPTAIILYFLKQSRKIWVLYDGVFKNRTNNSQTFTLFSSGITCVKRICNELCIWLLAKEPQLILFKMNLLELKVSFPIKTLGSAAPKATEQPGFWFLRNSALVTREWKVSLKEVSGTRRIWMKLAGTFWVRRGGKNAPWIKQGIWEWRSQCYHIQPRQVVKSFETFSHGSNSYLLHVLARWLCDLGHWPKTHKVFVGGVCYNKLIN